MAAVRNICLLWAGVMMCSGMRQISEAVSEEEMDAATGKCQRSCGDIPLAHFQAGDDAVQTYLNSRCDQRSCSGCTGHDKGRRTPCCKGTCLTPTQLEIVANVEIEPKSGGPNANNEIEPKGGGSGGGSGFDAVEFFDSGSGSGSGSSLDAIDFSDSGSGSSSDEDSSVCGSYGEVIRVFEEASKGSRMYAKTTSVGPDAEAANTLQFVLEEFAERSEGQNCDVAKMKWGKNKYRSAVKGFTKAPKLVAEIDRCCTKENSEISNGSGSGRGTNFDAIESVDSGSGSGSGSNTIPSEHIQHEVDVEDNDLHFEEEALGNGNACVSVGKVETAFLTAAEGSRMYAKTFSVGPDADAANALQAALEAFAENSKEQQCDVAKMTWGKRKYRDSVKGFTKAAKLVKEIRACCLE